MRLHDRGAEAGPATPQLRDMSGQRLLGLRGIQQESAVVLVERLARRFIVARGARRGSSCGANQRQSQRLRRGAEACYQGRRSNASRRACGACDEEHRSARTSRLQAVRSASLNAGFFRELVTRPRHAVRDVSFDPSPARSPLLDLIKRVLQGAKRAR